ncbi:MAG TPA: hypothetical protein DD381_14185 [Lentisphaeria bacterium]|nr:MAG: hypothetical protein A2X47_01080 [Lentisphaerae bacterium GWF2_38_69]HBM17473.1 hypothetical protein [Lentisphaeria bacterium]
MEESNAKIIIENLGLRPHPEGGHYRQVFKDSVNVTIEDGTKRFRTALTDIYFLLAKGEKSRFHKVRQTEIWHFYTGAPLMLYDLSEDLQKLEIIELGKGMNFKHTVKANHFQAAVSAGDYTLVGCSVAPGFEFEDFSFLSDDENLIQFVAAKYPNLKYLI